MLRRYSGLCLFGLGVLLIVLATWLLVSHMRIFSLKRDTAVMIGTGLPERRSGVALLAANVEAERMFQQEALAAWEEQASVYVLPDRSPVPRALRAMQETVLVLSREAGLSLSALSITFDTKTVDHGSVKTLRGKSTLRGNYQAVARFLGVLSFSGDMMIKDAFTPEAQEAFLRQVESSAPLSLGAAESFLYLDLLQYAANPDQAEQRMLQDMPTGVLADTRAFVLENGAADIRRVFEGIASRLRDKEVWPFPLMRIDHVVRSGDQWTVEFTLFSR